MTIQTSTTKNRTITEQVLILSYWFVIISFRLLSLAFCVGCQIKELYYVCDIQHIFNSTFPNDQTKGTMKTNLNLQCVKNEQKQTVNPSNSDLNCRWSVTHFKKSTVIISKSATLLAGLINQLYNILNNFLRKYRKWPQVTINRRKGLIFEKRKRKKKKE